MLLNSILLAGISDKPTFPNPGDPLGGPNPDLSEVGKGEVDCTEGVKHSINNQHRWTVEPSTMADFGASNRPKGPGVCMRGEAKI